MEEAQRLLRLPTYVFARLDELKDEARKKGTDLIDLGMGNPNVPPPKEVFEAMAAALRNAENSRYPTFAGLPEFRKAVIDWCKRQYHIDIHDNEITPLIGSKEGLIHLAFAYINPGDTTLVPMPTYPAHFNGTILAGGTPHILPTTEKTGFLPDLKAIDNNVAKEAKMLFLSYPSNPTAACAPKEFYEEAVKFSKKHGLILIHDFAYAEVYFDGNKPISIFSIPGAKDVAVEFHTVSKTFGMAGWRCGFAVGNKKIIDSLKKIKTNLDYGLFAATQRAAIAAMGLKNDYLDKMRMTYQKRRDIFVDGLNKLGWDIEKPKATMYVWFPVPKGYNSTDWSLHVLEKTGVVMAPGTAFGELGEGYVRAALVETEERIKEALERMEKAGIRYKAH
ncbi:LL-diaminopimelate aminotransferase [Candidatus Margulisiibacteriota bacterium]